MASFRPQREVIFEFHRVGIYVKVSALDIKTQEEVSLMGPASASKEYLQKLGYDKLKMVLEKKGLWT